MKKTYEAPVAEKLEFDYSEIVCQSGANPQKKEPECNVTTKKESCSYPLTTKNKIPKCN